MATTLCILLVEDDWTVRAALSEYLTKKHLEVVATDSYDAAISAMTQGSFDAAIVDIVLPRRSGERADFRDNTGLDVARELRRLQPKLGIVFLSAYMDRGPEVVQLFMEGHDHIAYLAKGSKPQELLDALHKVTRDGVTLEMGDGISRTRETVFDVAWRSLTPAEQAIVGPSLQRIATLSEAECHVLRALGMCLNRHEVAARLHVTAKAVDYHINNVYDKLLLHELPEGFSPSSLLIKIYLLSQLKAPFIVSARRAN